MKYHFNVQKKYSKRKWGFTLLEMLVVAGIFSLVVVIISSILHSVLLSRKVIASREKLQSNSNSIIEIIGKETRNSQLDYGYYQESEDFTQPLTILALVDKDDNRIVFQKSSGSDCYADQSACLVVGSGGSSWTNVTPSGIDLIDVKFYIEPGQDPFAQDPANRPNKQPLVTIVLKTQSIVAGSSTQVSNIVQTSMSNRTYQARPF
jgi:type II secretory pathway pseudopilin PulG